MEKPPSAFRIVTISKELPIMSMSEASSKLPTRPSLEESCSGYMMYVNSTLGKLSCLHFNLETFLTLAMELKLDEVTRLKWMEYGNDSKKACPYSKLLKFLDMQDWHFESVTFKRKPLMTTHKFYAAIVDLEEACVVCRKRKHPLDNCRKLQGMS